MKKRTKIIILSVMVLLLGVTGYLNIALNRQVSDKTPPTTTTASYFVAYRNDRESLRDQEMLTYDAIIASPNSSAEAKADAEKARLELVGLMDKELVVEGLIKAKGFDDCVVTISGSKVNAVVKANDLTDPQVAQIVDVIQQQLKVGIKNIKIFNVE